jgi:hypothetical protein
VYTCAQGQPYVTCISIVGSIPCTSCLGVSLSCPQVFVDHFQQICASHSLATPYLYDSLTRWVSAELL